jgi:hypothetical protein
MATYPPVPNAGMAIAVILLAIVIALGTGFIAIWTVHLLG